MISNTPTPQAVTRFRCLRTNGFQEKPGVGTYERCPFCGDLIEGDDHHETVVSILP